MADHIAYARIDISLSDEYEESLRAEGLDLEQIIGKLLEERLTPSKEEMIRSPAVVRINGWRLRPEPRMI